MGATKIEWTEYTVNPFPGCQKCSPGCLNCYAERRAKRLKAMGQAKYQNVVDENGWTGEIGCDLDCMRVPGKGKMVFCQSMGDLFYEGIGDEMRDKVMAAVALQQGHTFQVLTKRSDAMLKYFSGPEVVVRMCKEAEAAYQKYARGKLGSKQYARWYYGRHGAGSLFAWLHKGGAAADMFKRDEPGRPYPSWVPWPLPNLWLGVTVCNQQEADEKIPILLQIPAAVRFVSFEPLLEAIAIPPAAVARNARLALTGRERTVAGQVQKEMRVLAVLPAPLSWAVVGCETGPGARPCKLEDIDSIVGQCHAAGMPVFVKAIRVKNEIIKDINAISNMLGRSPESLRQIVNRKS